MKQKCKYIITRLLSAWKGDIYWKLSNIHTHLRYVLRIQMREKIKSFVHWLFHNLIFIIYAHNNKHVNMQPKRFTVEKDLKSNIAKKIKWPLPLHIHHWWTLVLAWNGPGNHSAKDHPLHDGVCLGPAPSQWTSLQIKRNKNSKRWFTIIFDIPSWFYLSFFFGFAWEVITGL